MRPFWRKLFSKLTKSVGCEGMLSTWDVVILVASSGHVQVHEAVGSGRGDQRTGFAVIELRGAKVLQDDIVGVEMAGEDQVHARIGQALAHRLVVRQHVVRELLRLAHVVLDDSMVHHTDNDLALELGGLKQPRDPVLGGLGKTPPGDGRAEREVVGVFARIDGEEPESRNGFAT